MSDLFEEDELVEGELFVNSEEEVALEIDTKENLLDARRRVENKLEEKLLQKELEDFLDY